MDIIRFAIEKPVTVIVGVILVVLFGIIGLLSLPYQLSPTVTEPDITVETRWPGATPYEIERDIIEEQENVLKGIPGLTEMESTSANSRGSITLRFAIGTDVDDALLRVSNKLNEVASYPENVEKPVINATGAETSPVIWTILKTREGNPQSISTYKTFFENEVRQHLERVEGVADLFIGGGRLREMHVVVKPEKLAIYGLTIREFIDIIRAENVNISAGNMGVGRRDYRIRTVAEFKSPEDIESIVLKSTGQQRITVADVARVEFGYEKATSAMMHNGSEGIAVGIKPEPGTNILAMTDRVEAGVRELNEGKLKDKGIYIDWAYDQRPYIQGAIDLVQRNILIGGVLAVIVLLIFLRSVSSTIVVGASIPISIVGTFILLNALGRNLNVVSLAGIAFASGMLVDSAIVVLENIDRHRRMGKSPFEAAYDGTREVWGAILASTVTTIAIFLPVAFIKEESGQLFRDIAISVTCAITLSLIVSVTVIPMLSKQLFGFSKRKAASQGSQDGNGNIITRAGEKIVAIIMGLVRTVLRSWETRVITIVGLTIFSVASAYLLLPKMEYLPQGNRNLVINILIPPPGLSYDESKEIGEHIFAAAKPHLGVEHNGLPAIKNMFYVGSDRFMLFGGISEDERRVKEFIPFFKGIIFSIPGMFGISQQAGIFQTRLGRGRSIDIDVSGSDINRLVQVAGALFGMTMKEIPKAQVRPIPSLELLYPEIKIRPIRDRLKASGMTGSDLGIALDVLMDGRKIGEFKEEGKKKIDLLLKASNDDIPSPEALYDALVTTPGGKVVPVSSLATLERTAGITQIRHLERNRTITVRVTPPEDITIQESMEIISGTLLPRLEKQGMLAGVDVKMSGAADKLTETRQVLQWNFILAVAIIYLLMSALFGNFIYPIIIMFTVPLAAAGGFIGLKLVNLLITPQPLDILTMLGFVILIGVVVNNAILIVHQALNNIRYHGMDYREAVLESTRTRLRPIYMSASTSIFAMLPLVVAPGPGSELYRGLGSVVLGGLALSTVFTIFVIPALLMFVIRMEKVKTEG
ncbi:MAG: efflux RND transporter permease subunit [Deltaproteobacteria bacterium]|nr:efflux RND transporter permease subunit [Deltaproteobacteria bacterium]